MDCSWWQDYFDFEIQFYLLCLKNTTGYMTGFKDFKKHYLLIYRILHRKNLRKILGRGWVKWSAYYPSTPDDLSSNPAEVNIFYLNLLKRTKINKKRLVLASF